MINPQWLELPMYRTNFHGPKDFRAIEARLYSKIWGQYFNCHCIGTEYPMFMYSEPSLQR